MTNRNNRELSELRLGMDERTENSAQGEGLHYTGAETVHLQ